MPVPVYGKLELPVDLFSVAQPFINSALPRYMHFSLFSKRTVGKSADNISPAAASFMNTSSKPERKIITMFLLVYNCFMKACFTIKVSIVPNMFQTS